MLSNLANLPIAHGGPQHAEFSKLGLRPTDILDFSVNLNPYGPCPAVLHAAQSADVTQYGDPRAGWTREQLADHLQRSPDSIALGNGAAELLWTLASVLADSTSPALIVGPSFSEYQKAITAHAGRLTHWLAREETQFRVDLPAITAQIRRDSPRSVYFCTPNNPTGTAVRIADIVDLSKTCPATYIIVDQAFLSLSEHHDDARVRVPENVILLRSLTKDHTIPGLRVAYLLASIPLVQQLENHRAPWTVSAPAQAALLASLGETDFVATCRAKMRDDADYLRRELIELSLHPLESSAPFLITRCPDAIGVRKRLLEKHHILVRHCLSFGLPDHLRLASKPKTHVDHLIGALRQELAG